MSDPIPATTRARRLEIMVRAYCMDNRRVNIKGEDALAELVAQAAALDAECARYEGIRAECDRVLDELAARVAERDRLEAALEWALGPSERGGWRLPQKMRTELRYRAHLGTTEATG